MVLVNVELHHVYWSNLTAGWSGRLCYIELALAHLYMVLSQGSVSMEQNGSPADIDEGLYSRQL